MPSPLNSVAVAVRRQPDLPFVPPLWRRIDRPRLLRDVAFVGIETVAFAAGCALIGLGLVVATLLVFAHFDVALFFGQVDNLASRFVGTDVARKAALVDQVRVGALYAFGIVSVLRSGAFIRRLAADLKSARTA